MKSVIILLLLLAYCPAATLPVTTTADAGAGSLRAQIAASINGDTVAITATGTISLITGEILITGKNLTITGPGANSLTITTNSTSRALHIVKGQCSISGLTFHNCRGLPGDVDTGGAVCVDNFTSGGVANVTTINDCVFTSNQSGWGGAVDIFNGGLSMNRCTFSNNTCSGMAFGTNGGGGALSLGPTVASAITNCTFTKNSQQGVATGQPGGGAIYNYGVGTMTPPDVVVEHCTFVGNVDSAGAAGAMKGNYTASYHTAAKLRNCLLVNNQAPVLVLRNFAGNATGTLTTSYTSLGGNVTDESATSALFMAPGGSDKWNNSALAASISPDPGLNGGTVPTHSISRGSPAQRSGQASTVATDGRGAPRHPQSDAGAYELIEPELAVTAATLEFGTTPLNTPVVKSLTLTNTQTSTFTTGPLVVGTPTPPGGFDVTGFPTTSLANGQSATFDVNLIAASPGLYHSSLTFNGNDRFDSALANPGSLNLHTISLSALVTDTIDNWRIRNFGPDAINSGSAANTADPAGDGIPNILKYALGLNPKQGYPQGAGIAAGLDPTGCLSMTVTKNPAAADILLSIEVSSDVGQASPWTSSETTIDLDSPFLLKAHDNVTTSQADRRFMRLRASKP